MENRGWKEGKLEDIAKIVMGQSPNGDTCNNTNGIPLLNGPTEFGLKNPKEVQFTIGSKKECKPYDILFCVRGSTTGRMNWADKTYSIGRGLAAINHKEGAKYNRFLKGVLDFNLEHLLTSATGSTFPNISRSQLEQLEILIPPLPEQKAIANILSNFDDKIDLLQQQNKTLEAMAESLFRQRFIEEAKEDWEDRSLYDSIKLIGGGTPKTSSDEYWNGDIKWLSGGDITNNHKNFVINSEKSITIKGLKNSSAKLLPKYSTVISARGTVGKYCLLAEPMTYSQSNYGIIPRIDNCFFFTYLLIAYSVEELQGAAYGSVFDTITTNTFKSINVKLPNDSAILEFEKEIEMYFFKMQSNKKSIQILTKLRDTLLPKLMNGEVSVNVD